MRTEEIVVPSGRSNVNPVTDVRGVRRGRTASAWSSFPERRIEIDGRPIRYIDVGGGPVLLFALAGKGMHLWRDVIVRLRERFRCVVLELPGLSLSPVLEPFVRRLELRDITLVLHDLFGPIALGIAPRLDDRIRALVVAESFGWPLHEETPMGPAGSPILPSWGDRPLLLVFGEESPAVRAGVPERWRERFPDAGLLLVEGAHRSPMTDDPDLVARAIRGWFREEVVAA
jgi:pimeloyl-ACP methyl ester carboxylesterase